MTTDEAPPSVVRICVAAINGVVGTLFLVRQPLLAQGDWRGLAVSLPSFVISGMAFKLAHAHQPWPAHATSLFGAATVFVIVSLCFLGRSFAVLPALRGIVVNGPYRFVRHPAYLGEWLLVLACCLAHPRWILMGLPLALIPCLLLRVLAEERVLNLDGDYRNYQIQVKWRLIPGIW